MNNNGKKAHELALFYTKYQIEKDDAGRMLTRKPEYFYSCYVSAYNYFFDRFIADKT